MQFEVSNNTEQIFMKIKQWSINFQYVVNPKNYIHLFGFKSFYPLYLKSARYALWAQQQQ